MAPVAPPTCKRVGVTVTIQPLNCGTLTAPRSSFVRGADDDELSVPVPSWLIRHPDGIVLFDTGMHEDLSRPSELLDQVSLFFQVGCNSTNLVSARLQAAGVDPADVDVVIASHLHFDHIGGLSQLPEARLVVHADEWAAGFDDELASTNALSRADFDLGHDVVTVEGEHDLFGDGRVVTIPTPGHTPGHQSLRVRTDGPDGEREVVLCGDCAYFESTLAGGALPPFGHDAEAQAASIARLRAMRDEGALVIPGHDPLTFRTLPELL